MGQCLITRKGGGSKAYLDWEKVYDTVYGDITGTFVTKYQGGYMNDGDNTVDLGSITNDTDKDRICICVFSSNLSFTFKGWTITNGIYLFQNLSGAKAVFTVPANTTVSVKASVYSNHVGAGKIPYCAYYWGTGYNSNVHNTREYIYKDGTFFIEPTTNTLQNVDGHLKGNGSSNTSRVVIPYAKSNKKIFYKFINSAAGTNTENEVGIGSTTPSQNSTTWSPYQYRILSRYSENNEVVISCLSNEIVYLNIYNNTIYCTEIWAEDIG